MNTELQSGEPGHELTIGELAAATGVSVATLRVWEARHGFPSSRRLPSGHRRYAAGEVDRVLAVQRHRAVGTRLDAAIEQARRASDVDATRSVHADLVRHHPDQPRQWLHKGTLLALSWAIEDEVAASGSRGHLFGAFQTAKSFEAARPRWEELARVAETTYVFADFGSPGPGDVSERITQVQLPLEAPMRREWTVVHDSPELPVALTASELPGQAGSPDRERLFEAVWTLDPRAVRSASRCCARLAAAAGHEDAAALAAGPLSGPAAPTPDRQTLTRLTQRVIAYADAGIHATSAGALLAAR